MTAQFITQIILINSNTIVSDQGTNSMDSLMR